MLSLRADGHEIGDEIAAANGSVIRIEAAAGSHAPMERIELVVNGAVVAEAAADASGRAAELAHELHVDGSCWIALRAVGPVHGAVLDRDGTYAHTSPIYVSVDGKPTALAEDAAYFVEWIERLMAMARERGVYPSDKARDEILAVFGRGQAYYRAIVG
jgi:hypothetical protein